MLKLISYFRTIKKSYQSKFSGKITVSYSKGKKKLLSKNTVYSFGELEALLSIGLQRLPNHNYESILVLGLGAGSVIPKLRRSKSTQITGVELDPVIIQIAIEEFKMNQFEALNIVQADAFNFVEQLADNNAQYDLVIIDLFINKQLADGCLEQDFWLKLHQLLKPEAQVLFNAGVLENDLRLAQKRFNSLKDRFQVKHYEKVMQQNDLYILEKK